MTAEEFNELAEKAIEKCFWRNTEFETPICKGNLAPCQVEDVTDYWMNTAANALRPLYQLLAMAQLRPDGIWEGD